MESFQPSLDMEFKMPVSVSKKSCENIENQIVENEEATSPASRKYYFKISVMSILTIF